MRVLAITARSETVSWLAAEPGVAELVVEPTMASALACLRERRWPLVLLDDAVDGAADLLLAGLGRAVTPWARQRAR